MATDKEILNLNDALLQSRVDVISPVGISVHATGRPDLFVVEALGDENRPIRSTGRIAAFRTEAACESFLRRLRDRIPPTIQYEKDYGVTCDIPATVQILQGLSSDKDCTMLDCINTLDDLVTSGSFSSRENLSDLLSLAAQLTYQADFGPFTQKRRQLIDSILWCTGAVMLDSTFVDDSFHFDSLSLG